MDGALQAHSGTIILENEDHRAGRAHVSFSARICTVCVHVCESLRAHTRAHSQITAPPGPRYSGVLITYHANQ